MPREQRLSLVYWFGALIDGLLMMVLLFPGILAAIIEMAPDALTSETRLILALGAVMSGGWGMLLLWGSQRPVARRGVLLITVMVDLALAVVALVALYMELLTFLQATVVWGVFLIIIVAFLWAYARAGRSMMFR